MCISLKLHLGWTDVQWIVCVCLCGSNKGLVASRLLLAGHWELTVWMWGDYVFTAGPVFTSAERMQRGGFGFGLVNLPARGLYLETVWVSLCVSVCVCMCGVCVCACLCVIECCQYIYPVNWSPASFSLLTMWADIWLYIFNTYVFCNLVLLTFCLR